MEAITRTLEAGLRMQNLVSSRSIPARPAGDPSCDPHACSSTATALGCNALTTSNILFGVRNVAGLEGAVTPVRHAIKASCVRRSPLRRTGFKQQRSDP